MRYVLGLSLCYHRYHKDARLRIFADDYLVEEIELSQDIKLKTMQYGDRPFSSFNQRPSNYSRVFIIPEKLFVFYIDEKYLKKKLRIEVQNDQNNHTNGFMTDWAWLSFYRMFLIPECLLECENWERIERFDSWLDNLPPYKYFPVTPLHKDMRLISSASKWKSRELLQHQIGGSFVMEIPFTRKRNIVHLGRLRPGKIGIDINLARFLCLFDLLNT